MWTPAEAQQVLQGLVQVARGGDERARRAGSILLAALNGREWLALDDNARDSGWQDSIVAGRGWAEQPVADGSSLLIAIVASWHVDGHLRERATQRLIEYSGPLSAAALAVRCLDHVEQVRAQALPGLLRQTPAEGVDVVVGILTTAAARRSAPAVLAAYTDRLLTTPVGIEQVLGQTTHADRGVHRWAVSTALDRRLLPASQVFDLMQTHTDQLVRVRCADWLASHAPETIPRLLQVHLVEARVAALRRLPDRDLTDTQLSDFLLDRSPRIRTLAQQRSCSRELDAAELYRGQLPDSGPRGTATALAGLASVGTAEDATTAAGFLTHKKPVVRAAAVHAIAALARPEDAVALAAPLMIDPSPRVITAATRALVRADAGPDVATAAWTNHRVAPRQAAWRLHRATGGWERVVADLRAAGDSDPSLAEHGRGGVTNWLAVRAATTWKQPTTAQRAAIADLLVHSGLDEHASQQLAFHAGLSRTTSTTSRGPDGRPEPVPTEQWWRWFARYRAARGRGRRKRSR